MTRINWDAAGSRLYENGLDRGVLYVDDQPGVPWNGLTSLTENSPGGVSQAYYVDGEKYANLSSREEFQATLTAFTYPDEFEVCSGMSSVRPGLLITKQKRNSFGLCYRTMIGNDQSNVFAYKLHLIYNVLAAPSNRAFKTTGGNTQVDDFSWVLTSLPPVQAGYQRSSHIILDSRVLDPSILSAIEDIVYGSGSASSRLPELTELADLIDTGNVLIVTDNGDGTYSMTAPVGSLYMLDSSIFQLTWPTAVFVDANTYTVTSS